jgi:hypothetical protein
LRNGHAQRLDRSAEVRRPRRALTVGPPAVTA